MMKAITITALYGDIFLSMVSVEVMSKLAKIYLIYNLHDRERENKLGRADFTFGFSYSIDLI